MNEISNEKRPRHTLEARGGTSTGDSRTLYNKISGKGTHKTNHCDIEYDYKLETPHGMLFIKEPNLVLGKDYV